MRLLSDEEIEVAVAKVEEPLIVSANSFRAVRKIGLPLASGKIKQISTAIGVSRFRVGEAVAILEIFNRYPEIRERWEDDLAAGRISLRKALWQIRADAAPLDRAAAAAQTAPVKAAPARRSTRPAPPPAAGKAKRAKRSAKS